jgi:hypothetical protein
MDPEIDRHYKQKYFPVGGSGNVTSSVQEDILSGYSTTEYQHAEGPRSVDPIIDSLLSLTILQIEAEDPSQPCYLSLLPDELLLQILLHLFLSSLSSILLTSLICKKFLSLTQREKILYKSLCKHYFAPFIPPQIILSRGQTLYANDFRRMLIERPRLHFSGVYIATCHYLRSGTSDLSWNTPIHMVTYFRYVRFFLSGECVCVLSTAEPR